MTPSVANAARSLVSTCRHAVLSSLSVDSPGYPFGSLVAYDLDAAGRPVIFISLIAQHYKNLRAHPRASLLVADPFSIDDPQAGARATLLARWSQVPESELTAIQDSYASRHPASVSREIAHNFVFFRAEIERVRWIGGFGEIAWIDPQEYCAAAFDPLAPLALSAIEHMNDDHQEALHAIISHTHKVDTAGRRVTMTKLTSRAFHVRVSGHGTSKEYQIQFSAPVETADELRREMIALKARAVG